VWEGKRTKEDVGGRRAPGGGSASNPAILRHLPYDSIEKIVQRGTEGMKNRDQEEFGGEPFIFKFRGVASKRERKELGVEEGVR